MQMTRKTDYAMRIMRAVGENNATGHPISVRAISEQENVPYQFARRISYDLANADLIKVTRGARGGAVLSKAADKITLQEIVEVGQGQPICSRCSLGEDWCENESSCNIKRTLEELDDIVIEYLSRIKLSDLLRDEANSAS